MQIEKAYWLRGTIEKQQQQQKRKYIKKNKKQTTDKWKQVKNKKILMSAVI